MRREPFPIDRPSPILIEIGMDVRLRVRLDMREFLRVHGLDPQSGEPSPDELQAILLERIRHYLKGQAYMRDADVRWIDEAIQ